MKLSEQFNSKILFSEKTRPLANKKIFNNPYVNLLCKISSLFVFNLTRILFCCKIHFLE